MGSLPTCGQGTNVNKINLNVKHFYFCRGIFFYRIYASTLPYGWDLGTLRPPPSAGSVVTRVVPSQRQVANPARPGREQR